MEDAAIGGMNDTNPTLVAAGFGAIVLVEALLVVFAVHRASRRAGDAERVSRRLAAITFGGIVAWLTITFLIARAGVLSDFESRPPRLMIMLLVETALFATITGTRTARRLLDATPMSWPIAIHTIRIPIELALFALFAAGKIPVQMTFEGRNFDVLVGLTAPLVAFAVARNKIGRRGVLAWNVLSAGLLANILGIAITTFPGPLHLDWPGVSNVILATPPFAWLPTFLVPVAIFGHVLSFRQLWYSRRISAPSRSACASS